MSYSPLAIKRRQVLGDIYDRCDAIESIPVYFQDKSDEPIGYAEESLGHFADAYLFRLPEMFCKRLSGGQFEYIFEFDYSDDSKIDEEKRRIKLTGILLVPKLVAVPKKGSADPSV